MKKQYTKHTIGQFVDNFKPQRLHIFLGLFAMLGGAIATIVLAAPGGPVPLPNPDSVSGDNQCGYGLEIDGNLYVRALSGFQGIRYNSNIPITGNEITIYGESIVITGNNGGPYNVFIPTKTEAEWTGFRNSQTITNLGIELETPAGAILPLCGVSTNSCTEGTPTNQHTLYGICGTHGCTSIERTHTYTWDCTNSEGTVNCTNNIGCVENIACEAT